MSKIKCDKCRNYARWFYMPSDGDGKYCDKHVPRGCSCNEYNVTEELAGVINTYLPNGVEGKDWKWIEKDIRWADLDGEGKELPCCEYAYEKEGVDKNEM